MQRLVYVETDSLQSAAVDSIDDKRSLEQCGVEGVRKQQSSYMRSLIAVLLGVWLLSRYSMYIRGADTAALQLLCFQCHLPWFILFQDRYDYYRC